MNRLNPSRLSNLARIRALGSERGAAGLIHRAGGVGLAVSGGFIAAGMVAGANHHRPMVRMISCVFGCKSHAR